MLALLSSAPLLLPGSVAVRLQEVGEVELEVAIEVANRLSLEIRGRTRSDSVVDDPVWECDRPDRCIAEIRSRTGMADVLLLRVLGGPTKIQLEAERVSDSAPGRSMARIARDRRDWGPLLQRLAEALFEAAPEPPLIPPPAEESGHSVLPWVLIGTGVVVAAIGAGLAASSDDASDEIGSSILYGDRRRELAARQRSHGLAANVLFGTATASVVAGAVLFVF